MLDWNKCCDPDPGHITGIQNDKIYSILITASEETRANEMNVESRTELDSHANMPVVVTEICPSQRVGHFKASC